MTPNAQYHKVVPRFVAEEFVEGNFLGLSSKPGDADVVILQVPYELTTSYGQEQHKAQQPVLRLAGKLNYLIHYSVKIYLPDIIFTLLQSGMEKATH